MKRHLTVLALFLGLVVLYNANATVMDEGDAVPTINLPFALMQTGRISFDPDVHPELFKWTSKWPFIILDDFFLVSWRQRFGGKPATEWRKTGHLSFNGPRYYLVDAPKRSTYVSTFGLIPGLVALPFVAPFYALDHDLAYKLALKTSVGKVAASSLIALCAVLVYLIARARADTGRALRLALLYGLGTCVWAVSSQNMWQQTVNQFWLTLGAYFFLAGPRTRSRVFLSALCLGASMAVRPPFGTVTAACLAYLFLYERRHALTFALGVLPFPLVVAGYNTYFFGTPFAIAQEMVGHVVATEKTGSPALWQTPFLLGAAGLLVSPSRGLLVFSPVLGLAFWGMYRVFQDGAYRDFRPFVLAALVPMALQCKWFDWWGGWTYGYRPWLDAVPYLTLFILPVLDDAIATPLRRGAFVLSFAWSVFVQGLGALAYDHSWNLRQIFVVRRPDLANPEAFMTEREARDYANAHDGTFLGPSLCNIDLPFCRHRLWSLEDNIISYTFTHYREARARRLPPSWEQLGKPLMK